MKGENMFNVSAIPEESLGEGYIVKADDAEKEVELKSFHRSVDSLNHFFKENENLRRTTHNEIPLSREKREAWQALMDMMPNNTVQPSGHHEHYVTTRFGVPEIDVSTNQVMVDQLLYQVQSSQDKKPLQRTVTRVTKDDPFLKEVTPETMKQMTDLLSHNFEHDKKFISADQGKLDEIFVAFSWAHNSDQLEGITMDMKRTLRFYNSLENVNIVSAEVAEGIHTIKCSLALIVDLMEEMKEFYESLPKEGNALNDKRDPLIKKFGRRLYLSMSTAEIALKNLAKDCEEMKQKIRQIENILVGENK